jgi:hypothetical protein
MRAGNAFSQVACRAARSSSDASVPSLDFVKDNDVVASVATFSVHELYNRRE